MSEQRLKAEVASRLDEGQSLANVQAELIEPAHWLGEEGRDALWLFAWSYHASRAHAGERPIQLA